MSGELRKSRVGNGGTVSAIYFTPAHIYFLALLSMGAVEYFKPLNIGYTMSKISILW